jgi:putative transcriptional regulator
LSDNSENASPNSNLLNKNDELTMMAGSIVLSENPPQQLKFWRKKFGVKQADLAKKMDITPSVLSDYEKGRRPSPGVVFIRRYLLALYELAKTPTPQSDAPQGEGKFGFTEPIAAPEATQAPDSAVQHINQS